MIIEDGTKDDFKVCLLENTLPRPRYPKRPWNADWSTKYLVIFGVAQSFSYCCAVLIDLCYWVPSWTTLLNFLLGVFMGRLVWSTLRMNVFYEEQKSDIYESLVDLLYQTREANDAENTQFVEKLMLQMLLRSQRSSTNDTRVAWFNMTHMFHKKCKCCLHVMERTGLRELILFNICTFPEECSKCGYKL